MYIVWTKKESLREAETEAINVDLQTGHNRSGDLQRTFRTLNSSTCLMWARTREGGGGPAPNTISTISLFSHFEGSIVAALTFNLLLGGSMRGSPPSEAFRMRGSVFKIATQLKPFALL